jgi:uncharacterized damage-inducible protein DinB
MDDALQRQFLDYSIDKLREYTGRIETCLGMLNEEQVWARRAENENAAGNLVLHLCGNVRQWIVSAVGARPDVRERDREFSARGGVSIAALTECLRTTVEEAAGVLRAVTAERMAERLVIQGYKVSVMEAIYHVVEHFSMHTGQIMFATKLLTGTDLGFYAHLSTAASHAQKTP